MNCILFAAGNGMRLRPLTEDIQKCMLPVFGKPMLEWWLDAAFKSECFDSVYVNLHHMHAKVDSWLSMYCSKKRRKVNRIDESSRLLGTAGTLFYHAEIGKPYMTAYTDTFSEDILADGGLMRLFEEWRNSKGDALAGLVPFKSPPDDSAGRIVTDGKRNVIGFKEKASAGKGIVWSGIMFADAAVVDMIGQTDKDLAADVLPRLCHKMITVGFIDAYDIGRGLEHYERLRDSRTERSSQEEPGVQTA